MRFSSWPGIEPGSPALGVQSISHWTSGEVPTGLFFGGQGYFYYFFFSFIYLFTLQYCIGFAIRHGCTCVPHPECPSHLPAHPIPLGNPSAPALSTLSHALNLDWRFVSHVIIYLFQCHSPISSHPRPLAESPKDCSIHLCLLLSHIQGYRYHLSKFHIYALVYCIGVLLSGLLHFV